MVITIITRTEEEVEKCDYRDVLEIHIDGKRAFRVSDGEPEDSNLRRDFSACFNIPDMMKKAHEAGWNHEPFEVEMKEDADI